MAAFAEVEKCFEAALLWLESQAPRRGQPSLAHAVRYALMPAGGRARPRLTLTIGEALGVENQALPAATAIELIHNASLVHDDMPCFDDAPLRRGKPSVPHHFGPAMGLLVGDALLSLAFREAARVENASLRQRLAETACLLVGGQAMELTAQPTLDVYHGQKTACLFALAAQAPAVLAGLPPEPFASLGDAIGRSYQLADDLFDQSVPQPSDAKLRGRDGALGKPNVALLRGEAAAQRAFADSVEAIEECVAALPCPTSQIERFVRELTARFSALALPPSSLSMHARRQRHVTNDVALGSQ